MGIEHAGRSPTDGAKYSRRQRSRALLGLRKRLGELGYPLEPAKSKGANDIVKLAGSRSADTKKFHALGIGVKQSSNSDNQGDRLLGLLSDTTIDSKTGELLGRFICEERDSGRLLTDAYKSMQRRLRYKKKQEK